MDKDWFCPAIEGEINAGLCWEYCFADGGGPTDTANDLKKWIRRGKKFTNLDEFHKVCEACPHCQWDNGLNER